MEKIEILLLIYGCFIFCTVFVLSYFAVYQLDIYLTAFAIEFFLAVLVTSPYGHAETRRQMVIGAVLVVIFIGIVFEHILIILR
jgi:hypothetical protein